MESTFPEVLLMVAKSLSLLVVIAAFIIFAAGFYVGSWQSFWFLGWVVCRTWTLGTFPRQSILDMDQVSGPVGRAVFAVGLLSLIVAGTGLACFLKHGG